jgi:hypothetical protein
MGQSLADTKKELDKFVEVNKPKREAIAKIYANWVKSQTDIPALSAEQKAIETRAKALAARASKLAELYAANSANLAADAARSHELKIINSELSVCYFSRSLWDLVSAVAGFFPAFKPLVTITDAASEVGEAAGKAVADRNEPHGSDKTGAGTIGVKGAKAAGDVFEGLRKTVAPGLKAANAILDLITNAKETVEDWKKNGPEVGKQIKLLLTAMKDCHKMIPMLAKDPKVRKVIEETLESPAGKGIDSVLSAMIKVITAIDNASKGFESAGATMESAAAEVAAGKVSAAQLGGAGKVTLPKDLLKKDARGDLASLSTINGVQDAERYVDELIRRMNAARDAVTTRKKDLDKMVVDMQAMVKAFPAKELEKLKADIAKLPDKDPAVKDYAKLRKAVVDQFDQERALVEPLLHDIPKLHQ